MKKYMVTSIPTENELYSLQRKIKKWYLQQKLTKEINYIYQNVINYFNLCQKY
nr:IS481 family transposase [Spiroplasma sp. Moj]